MCNCVANLILAGSNTLAVQFKFPTGAFVRNSVILSHVFSRCNSITVPGRCQVNVGVLSNGYRANKSVIAYLEKRWSSSPLSNSTESLSTIKVKFSTVGENSPAGLVAPVGPGPGGNGGNGPGGGHGNGYLPWLQ